MTISNATIHSLDRVLRGDRPNVGQLTHAFGWSDTREGASYWSDMAGEGRMSKNAINKLRRARRQLRGPGGPGPQAGPRLVGKRAIPSGLQKGFRVSLDLSVSRGGRRRRRD